MPAPMQLVDPLRARRTLSDSALTDPRSRKLTGPDFLTWTESWLASGIGARHMAVMLALASWVSASRPCSRLLAERLTLSLTL